MTKTRSALEGLKFFVKNNSLVDKTKMFYANYNFKAPLATLRINLWIFEVTANAFPRLRKRGSIEAGCVRFDSGTLRLSFHCKSSCLIQ